MNRLAHIFLLLVLALASACESDDVKLDHIYLVVDSEKLAPGDTTKIHVMSYPANATIGFPADNASVIWSSSNEEVGVVDSTGVFYALAFGKTTIRLEYGPFITTKELTVSTVANIVDETLLSFLLDNFDTNGDGILEGYETQSYTGIDLTGLGNLTVDVVDMTGFTHFINLQTLRAERIGMANLDLSAFSKLSELYIEACDITDIDLRFNPNITDVRLLECTTLKTVTFGDLDTYGTNNLRTLQVRDCDVSSLDLSRCAATLWDLDVAVNPSLSSLDLTTDTCLHSLIYSCSTTSITWPTDISIEEVIQPECVD